MVVDPGTAIAAVGSAVVGARILGPTADKILGPTADYLGDGLQQWTERRVENLRRVFEKADRKLGPEALESDGSVPPRVLKGILDEGGYRDDELGAEYLGGVLASSRTAVARDDRGASLVALVGRLSTYQLRAHYIMYSQAQRALVGTELNLGQQQVRRSRALFLPFNGFPRAMDLNTDEFADFSALLSHTLHGLIREELMEDEFKYGSADHLRGGGVQDFGVGGVIYRVSPLGMELYCAAHGIRGNPLTNFIDPDIEFRIEPPVEMIGSFGLVADLPRVSRGEESGQS
jgi:hypothetical protein